MTETYRWNVAEHAAGYDAAAEHLHPHYVEIQDHIVAQLGRLADAEFLLVDLGGGSGRLVEKVLTRFERARAVVVDQSQTFLDLARARLARFGPRAVCQVARLQEDWTSALPGAPVAIVSMSAIHHLDTAEKQRLYQQCHDVLAPHGLLLNGDEVRPDDDGEYRAAVSGWSDHMLRVAGAGLVSAAMRSMLEAWRERNVANFGGPRASGDDCHETADAQLAYFRGCGFGEAACTWQRQLWAVLKGVK